MLAEERAVWESVAREGTLTQDLKDKQLFSRRWPRLVHGEAMLGEAAVCVKTWGPRSMAGSGNWNIWVELVDEEWGELRRERIQL